MRDAHIAPCAMLDRVLGDALINAPDALRAKLDQALDDAHIGAPEAPCKMLDRALGNALIDALEAPRATLDHALGDALIGAMPYTPADTEAAFANNACLLHTVLTLLTSVITGQRLLTADAASIVASRVPTVLLTVMSITTLVLICLVSLGSGCVCG